MMETSYCGSTHRIHGTGIFTYLHLVEFVVNLGKYTSPMDPMGYSECTFEVLVSVFWLLIDIML